MLVTVRVRKHSEVVVLSARLERWIRNTYEPQDVDDAIKRLGEVSGGVPGWDGHIVATAVAMLGNGDMERLEKAAILALVDPRDVIGGQVKMSESRLHKVLDLGEEPTVRKRWRQPGGPPLPGWLAAVREVPDNPIDSAYKACPECDVTLARSTDACHRCGYSFG